MADEKNDKRASNHRKERGRFADREARGRAARAQPREPAQPTAQTQPARDPLLGTRGLVRLFHQARRKETAVRGDLHALRAGHERAPDADDRVAGPREALAGRPGSPEVRRVWLEAADRDRARKRQRRGQRRNVNGWNAGSSSRRAYDAAVHEPPKSRDGSRDYGIHGAGMRWVLREPGQGAITFQVFTNWLPPEPREPELRLLHRWLDSWSGIGHVVAGMARQGYRLHLTNIDASTWRATFSHDAMTVADGFAAAPTPRGRV
jgi:hypothetical protein